MSRMLPMLNRAQIAIPAGGGEPLEPTVQAKMEKSFRNDFSAVRIHQGRTAADLGALAFTSGNNVHFAPGQYDPHSPRGQELLGHELAHVVQQSSGRVQPTVQGKGMAINEDHSLEREADEAGVRAARGEPAGLARGGHTPSAVVQGKFTHDEKRVLKAFLDWLEAHVPAEYKADFVNQRSAETPAVELDDWLTARELEGYSEQYTSFRLEVGRAKPRSKVRPKKATAHWSGPRHTGRKAPSDREDEEESEDKSKDKPARIDTTAHRDDEESDDRKYKLTHRPRRGRFARKPVPDLDDDSEESEDKPAGTDATAHRDDEEREEEEAAVTLGADPPRTSEERRKSKARVSASTLAFGRVVAPLAARAEASAKRKLLRADGEGVERLTRTLSEAPNAGHEDAEAAPVFAGQSHFHQALAVQNARPPHINFRPYAGITTNTRPLLWKKLELASAHAALRAGSASPKAIQAGVTAKRREVDSEDGYPMQIDPACMVTSGGGHAGTYPALRDATRKALKGLRIRLEGKKRRQQLIAFLRAPMSELGRPRHEAGPSAPAPSEPSNGTKRKRTAPPPALAATTRAPSRKKDDGHDERAKEMKGETEREKGIEKGTAKAIEDEADLERQIRDAQATIAASNGFVLTKHLLRGIEPFRREGVFTLHGIALDTAWTQEQLAETSSAPRTGNPLSVLMDDAHSIMSPPNATQWYHNEAENERQLEQIGRIVLDCIATVNATIENGLFREPHELAAAPADDRLSLPRSAPHAVIAPVARALVRLRDLDEHADPDELAGAERDVVDAMIHMNAEHEDLPAIDGRESPEMSRREHYTMDRKPPASGHGARAASGGRRKTSGFNKQVRVGRTVSLSQPTKDYEDALKIPVATLSEALASRGLNKLRLHLKKEHGLTLSVKQLKDLLHVQGLRRQKGMTHPAFKQWGGT